MNRWMEPQRWLGGCVLALLLSSPALFAQNGTLVGRIIEDDAEVRAGAGTSYYLVGKLKKDTVVNVEDRFFEWYKVSPPSGVYSYVKKDRIDLLEGGKRGVVNTDRTAVKAASVDGPGESYRRQIDMHKGDEVDVIAEEGDYYKIKPPKHAYVFVRVATVRREELMPAVAETPPAAATVEPTAPEPAPEPSAVVETPTVVETPAAATVTPPGFEKPLVVVENPAAAEPPIAAVETPTVAVKPPVETPTVAVAPPIVETPTVVETPAVTVQAPAVVETPAVVAEAPATNEVELADLSLEELEKQYKAIQTLPLEQQPISTMLAAYQAKYNASALEPRDHRLVLMRIVRLRRNAQLAQTLREISQVQQSLHTAPVIQTSTGAELQRVEYDAVGQLVASGVYDGINLPRLYRLVSPTLRTVAYVRPSSEIDTINMLGRIVGVIGESRYDPALKLSVLEANDIEVLKAEAARSAGVLGALSP